MRYLIMGAGALGTVFGGLLLQAGQAVDFIGRGEHFTVMRRQGLTIDGLWGEVRLGPVGTPPELPGPGQLYDVILLCVKSFDTLSACRQLKGWLAPRGLVISIQNGLGNLEVIAGECGPEAAIGARVIFGARVSRPGVATVTVYADKVLLGAVHTPHPHLPQVAAHLNEAGIPTALVDNIVTHLWEKVLYNCALNPLGAILRVTYGDLAADPHSRELMAAIIREIYQVAAAKAIPLHHPTAKEYLGHFLERLVPPTAAHYSSMVQDLQMGRQTEIEALNGAICRYGQQFGLATPYNDAVCQLIRFLQARNLAG